jgi:hypothetical protein
VRVPRILGQARIARVISAAVSHAEPPLPVCNPFCAGTLAAPRSRGRASAIGRRPPCPRTDEGANPMGSGRQEHRSRRGWCGRRKLKTVDSGDRPSRGIWRGAAGRGGPSSRRATTRVALMSRRISAHPATDARCLMSTPRVTARDPLAARTMPRCPSGAPMAHGPRPMPRAASRGIDIAESANTAERSVFPRFAR